MSKPYNLDVSRYTLPRIYLEQLGITKISTDDYGKYFSVLRALVNQASLTKLKGKGVKDIERITLDAIEKEITIRTENSTTVCVYILDIFCDGEPTDIVKVGYTSNIDDRITTLNENWCEHGITFKHASNTTFIKRSIAVELERSIHRVLEYKELSYSSPIKCDGSSEFFYKDDLIYNIVSCPSGHEH